MVDQLEIVKQVTKRLDQAGIAYMVSGSMAMNFYAQPRMTRDIDIVIALELEDVDRLVAIFALDFYVDDEIVRTAVATPGLFNIIHNESVVKIDFIVRKNSDYRRKEFQRRRRVVFHGADIWWVSAEDLVLSKLVWSKDSHSEMQLRDIRNLIDSVENLDWVYIDYWAQALAVQSLLSEVKP